MTKKASCVKASDIKLSQTTLIRPSGRARFPEFGFALDALRPWVGFGEAIRIYEKTFGISPT
jgi:hypothetical protein